jgi:succinylglutamate desuccinylase
VYFLDLHTTSAEGIPFAMVGDEPRSRDFALHFPLPLILGLLEQVDAPLLEYMRRRGCVTLGIEAGQHDSERSIEHHQAVLWIALASSGMLRRDSTPDLVAARALLARTRRGLPHVMRVEGRHAITPEDRFCMQPGFANIERIHAGQLLAHDRRGDIHAQRDGILFMPLYQSLGDDGFFLGRAVNPLPLRLGAISRRWRR